MSITDRLRRLALRPFLDAGAQSIRGDGDSENVAGFLGRYLDRHGPSLDTSLLRACAWAWTALEIVLAGPPWWERCRHRPDVEADHELQRNVTTFLEAEPAQAAGAHDPVWRRESQVQVQAARQTGVLTARPAPLAELLAAPLGQPLAEDRQDVEALAGEFHRRGYPGLARLLRLPGDEPPLVVTAARFFLQWQLADRPALSAGPLAPPSPLLTGARATAWGGLAAALERHGPRLEELLRLDSSASPESASPAQLTPAPWSHAGPQPERLERDAIQALAAVARTVRERPTAARQRVPPRSPRTQPLRRRWRVWTTAVLAVVLVLAGVGIYVVWKGSMPAEGPRTGDWKDLIPPVGATPQAAPLTAEELPRALADLRSTDPGRRRTAAARLARTPPSGQQATVARDLARLVQDRDAGVKLAAVEALGTWGTADSESLLVPLTGAYSGELRWAAIEALAKLGDDRGAAAIADRLKEPGDREEAGRVLRGMGAKAEKAVIGSLRSPDPAVRREACQLLEQIGTKESATPLEKATHDPDEGVRRAAEAALKTVRGRA
jgi:hypothetical protein